MKKVEKKAEDQNCVERLRSDNDTEFRNAASSEFCKDKCIIQEFSATDLVNFRYFNCTANADTKDTKDEASEDVVPIDVWEEEDEAEPEIGDGGDGGGIVLHNCSWGARALSIAQEVLPQFGDNIELFSFKTTPRRYIYVRLDKLPNKYGCPEIEVSSPGAERLLKVPDDLQRFQDMPMKVSYVDDVDAKFPGKTMIFYLDVIETESGNCVWRLADVKENRDPVAKGRPFSRKQKDWRLKLPYGMVKKEDQSGILAYLLRLNTSLLMVNRLDGRTEGSERQKLVGRFNEPSNKRVKCTLISIRAGSLGINLQAANRVIIVDGSWNPTHDLQAIYQVWRYGQTNSVYAYRLLAHGTMEEKIYKRQVTKESLAARVVDRQQVHRTISKEEMLRLFDFSDDEHCETLPEINH
ncbi:hypothetical protein AgCh_021197 [Apium graveolens]